MVGPSAMAATALHRETGIAQSTLSRWLLDAASIRSVPTKPDVSTPEAVVDATAKRPQDWTPLERAKLVLEADGLGDAELGELLRRRGIHREQFEDWRCSLEEALAQPRSRRSGESKRIKELEREVAYKDKALAETAALLVLQKKLQLLFPAEEADDTDEKNDK
jgi:hypothetical protein